MFSDVRIPFVHLRDMLCRLPDGNMIFVPCSLPFPVGVHSLKQLETFFLPYFYCLLLCCISHTMSNTSYPLSENVKTLLPCFLHVCVCVRLQTPLHWWEEVVQWPAISQEFLSGLIRRHSLTQRDVMQQKSGRWKEANLKSFHLPFTRMYEGRAVKHKANSPVKFHHWRTQN